MVRRRVVLAVIGIVIVLLAVALSMTDPLEGFTFQSPLPLFISPLRSPGKLSEDNDYYWPERGSEELPDDGDYVPADFCPPTPMPPSPAGDNAVMLPLVLKEYRYFNPYGVAGADKGDDACGECPGTDEMAALGLSGSLSMNGVGGMTSKATRCRWFGKW